MFGAANANKALGGRSRGEAPPSRITVPGGIYSTFTSEEVMAAIRAHDLSPVEVKKTNHIPPQILCGIYNCPAK